MAKRQEETRDQEAGGVRPWLAAFAAWLVPGLGHWVLGRMQRGMLFFAVVVSSVVLGSVLDGNLASTFSGQPLAILATLGSMGMGLPYFVLRLLGYTGDLQAAGYEYGTAFMLSAGLMNLLLVLDCWDIGHGKKP